MAQLVPVSRERHAGRYWRRFSDLFFVAKASMAPLVARELPIAALNFPSAFAKEKDRYTLVGLFSLFPGQNLYVSPEGKWLSDYLPAYFRSHPFYLLNRKDSSEMALCVDEDSGLVVEDKGEPFFGPTGELSKPVKDTFEMLKQAEQNRQGTQLAVAALDEAGLIIPWDIKAV